MGPLTSAIGMLSPAGRRARLTILIFHRVLSALDPLFPEEPDAARFDQMLGWIKSWFHVLPLDEAVRRRATGSLPARAASITFDDGYADNHDVALPILRHHGISATFFIATGYLDGGCMWNDRVIAAMRQCSLRELDLTHLQLGHHPLDSVAERRNAIDAILSALKYEDVARREEMAQMIAAATGVASRMNLMLTSTQVRGLRAAGMQVGAHTVSHPILARVDLDAARREARASRDMLRDLLGESIDLFAYPNGKPGTDYSPAHVAMIRELGFASAVSTEWGAARADTDPMQLPRFTPWDRTRGMFGVRMLRNLVRSPGGLQ